MVSRRTLPLLLFALVLGAASPGRDGESERPGALPLPRFAALGSDKIHVRAGPGRQYPIEWVFLRRGLPVEITQEFELWRKVRDSEGAEGWVQKGLLSGKRMAMIRGPQTRDLHREPEEMSVAVARAEPGVIGRLLKCRGAWCQMSVGERKGWIQKAQLWGVYANEQID